MSSRKSILGVSELIVEHPHSFNFTILRALELASLSFEKKTKIPIPGQKKTYTKSWYHLSVV